MMMKHISTINPPMHPRATARLRFWVRPVRKPSVGESHICLDAADRAVKYSSGMAAKKMISVVISRKEPTFTGPLAPIVLPKWANIWRIPPSTAL